MRVDESKGDKYFFKVSWEPRADGFHPKESIFSSNELKKFSQDLLFDFYEQEFKENRKINRSKSKIKMKKGESSDK